jgi:prepilin-type processing-associated H-X9-DG protein
LILLALLVLWLPCEVQIPSLLTLTKKSSVGWANGLHYSDSISGSGGNIAFVDGHVVYLTPKSLNAAFQKLGLGTNRFAIP